MNFTDKYISESEKATDMTSKKTMLTDDAFAIGEMLELMRITLLNGRLR